MLIPLGFLAGSGGVALDTSYELIESTILGTAQSSVTFTGLSAYSATYKHLQIRAVARSTFASAADGYKVTFNNASGYTYGYHLLIGTGSSVVSAASSSNVYMIAGDMPANSATANAFGASVMDILDAFSTTKNKTMRSLTGDASIRLTSGFPIATAAIGDIKLETLNGGNYAVGTRVSLYGVKG
jgi:hypothetical protein